MLKFLLKSIGLVVQRPAMPLVISTYYQHLEYSGTDGYFMFFMYQTQALYEERQWQGKEEVRNFK